MNITLKANRTGQGISRYTWEGIQTWAGYNAAQFYNSFWEVDNVSYFGGATLTNSNSSNERGGMTLGSYIMGKNLRASTDDWMFMHEYGHTFDSQIFGPAYLFAVGIPSALSASRATQVQGEPAGVSTHDFFWTEMRANRHAEQYFSKHYDVNWLTLYRSGTIETYYPRRRR
jgi:hypothetical protein